MTCEIGVIAKSDLVALWPYKYVILKNSISAVLVINHASNGLESRLYTWFCCKFCLHNAQGNCIAIPFLLYRCLLIRL